MSITRDLPTRYRIGSLAVAPLLALLLLGAILLVDMRDLLLTEKRHQVQDLVDSAHGLVVHYHAAAAKGAMSDEAARAAALAALKDLRYGDGDYFWVNDMHPTMLMHPMKPKLVGADLSGMKDPDGKLLFMAMTQVVRQNGAGFVDYQWPKPGAERPVPKVSYVRGFEPWGWVIGSGIYIDDVDARFQGYLSSVLFVGLPLLLVMSLLGWVITNSVVRPLAVMQRIVKQAAGGDLGARSALERADEFGQMGESIDRMLASFEESMSAMQAAARDASRAAEDLNRTSTEMTEATQDQAASLVETSASLETMTGTVTRNADRARQADELASAARRTARDGEKVVEGTVVAMSEIRESSGRIAEIVSTMDEIAFRTNLLALNASIEAARAGEHGRGFAVVAAEVRALAQNAGRASSDVRKLVSESAQRVEQGAGLAANSGKSLARIVEHIDQVAALMSEIATESSAHADSVEQVNTAIAQMDVSTHRTADQSEHLNNTAASLAAQAAGLEQLLARYSSRAGKAPPALPQWTTPPLPM